LVKIRPVDPEVIGLKTITKKKKIKQAEYIACEAGMPGGLNNDFIANLVRSLLMKEL